MAKKWTEVDFFFLDFWGPTPYNRSMRKTKKVNSSYDAISSLTPEEAGELLTADDGHVVSVSHSGIDWSDWITSPTVTSSGAGAWSTISGGSLGSSLGSPGTVTVKAPLECEGDIKAPNIQAMKEKIEELEARLNDLESRRRGFFVKPRI